MKMHINALPIEVIIEITKFLGLKECIHLRHALRYHHIDIKFLLQNSKIYYEPTLFKVNSSELYILLRYSALNPVQAYNLLYFIDQELITKDNKNDMVLQYCTHTANRENINHTIKLIQQMLLMIEHRFNENNIINNVYCTIYSMINKVLIDYFTDVCKLQYTVTIQNHKTTKFRYMLFYEDTWYKTDINLYYLFILYLINLNIIAKKHLKKVRRIFSSLDSKPSSTLSTLHETNILELFNTNEAKAVAYSMIYNYCCNSREIYDEIMDSDAISTYMKNKITNQTISR